MVCSNTLIQVVLRGADDFAMRIQDDAGNVLEEEVEEDTVPSVIVCIAWNDLLWYCIVRYGMVLYVSLF